jgi:predicted AAA+ superfamily ATPase
MIDADLQAFGQRDLHHRFLHGGLPPFFLASDLPERDFQEWMDAYWAKDITELFRLERRHSFTRFAELLMAQSGAIFEATRFAPLCEVSRTTISNYLSVLEATFVVHVIRPFSSHRPTEIVSAPKVYGFDTGFVCYHRGWSELRAEDMGLLWEHFVLNELMAHRQSRDIRYWRDKQHHEIDFILSHRNQPPVAIECKWSASGFRPESLIAFRKQYPRGENFVVSHDVDRAFTRTHHNLTVRFVSLGELIAETASLMQP